MSVVVPVYNDPDGIRTTLNSLVSQTADDYEVLPVDNDSMDDTGDIITEFATDYPDRVRPLKETGIQSSYAARNTGIENASGDFLLFLDADMWVEETWIEDVVSVLESRDCDYLGCNVDIIPESESPSFWERYERALSFPIKTYLERKHFAPTCALAVHRKVFKKVGLFDHRLESGGDKEFGQRVHRAGFEQCYTGDVTAYHPARDSWGALRSKALRIGRGRAQKRQYYPDAETSHHPIHPINFLPPSPARLRRRFSGQDISVPSLVGFYLLEYVLKLIQSYGAIRETLSQRHSDQEASR